MTFLYTYFSKHCLLGIQEWQQSSDTHKVIYATHDSETINPTALLSFCFQSNTKERARAEGGHTPNFRKEADSFYSLCRNGRTSFFMKYFLQLNCIHICSIHGYMRRVLYCYIVCCFVMLHLIKVAISAITLIS